MVQIIYPILVCILLSLIVYPILIPFLKKIKFGQVMREDGPQAHLSKKGTPMMGGIGIVFVAIVVVALSGRWTIENGLMLFIIVGFGFVGFLDDYLKVVKKINEGLKVWQKIVLQLLITTVYIVISLVTDESFGLLIIPFTKGYTIDLGLLTIPFMILFILGTVNSVNIIDGLDGLASSVTIIVAIFFTFAALYYKQPEPVISIVIIGSLLGFLIFNCYPARVFMGDTGSLALGGYVAGVSIVLNMPLFILISGLIYFIDIMSVMIQVAVYKKTKKRIFKMAPIHHHFELLGYHETKVVVYFTMFTIVACLVGVLAL